MNPEHSPLEEILVAHLKRHGRIRFRDFMALCLYHPEHGYYMQKEDRTGKEGDFFTNADLSPLFARLIGRQAEEMWRRLGRPSPFTLVEMGAGQGLFAQDFLTRTAETSPEFSRSLRYVPIETNRRQAEAALDRLRAAGLQEKVAPARNLEALEPITGCFFANELVDAFPVSWVARTEGHLKEVYLTRKESDFKEELGPLDGTEVAQYVARYAHETDEGCRVEVNLAGVDWMRAVAAKLRRGFALTIDYGHLAPQLYRIGQPRGTLLAFRRHRATEDVYAEPGRRDLTAHVNFSALIDAGTEAGLELTGFTTQEKFLMGLGEQDQFERVLAPEGTEAQKLEARLQLKRLLNPEDMGEVFKVLIQHRGVKEPNLAGLKYASPVEVPGPGRAWKRAGPSSA